LLSVTHTAISTVMCSSWCPKRIYTLFHYEIDEALSPGNHLLSCDNPEIVVPQVFSKSVREYKIIVRKISNKNGTKWGVFL